MFEISDKSVCNDKNSSSGSPPAKMAMDEIEKDPNKSGDHKAPQKPINVSESQSNAQQNVKTEEKVLKPLKRISKWLAPFLH